MDKIQYTIRNVPADVDTALHLRAKKKKQSFNTTIVQALQQATGAASAAKKSKGDFDWFYGSGGLDQEELNAFAGQRVIDKKSWNL